jgi:acetate kinase
MRKISLIVMALALVGMACACPNLAGVQSTLDVVQQTVIAGMTEIPATIKAGATELAKLTPVSANGTIRGHLIYPSEVLVAQRIIAFDTATMTKVAEVSTVQGQNTYELSVPEGDYFVVAYTLDGKLSAGYSNAVPCGLSASCEDHSLIAVHVGSGAVVENIDPQDWYAPAGAFPPMP